MQEKLEETIIVIIKQDILNIVSLLGLNQGVNILLDSLGSFECIVIHDHSEQ